MPAKLRRLGYAPAVLAVLVASLLACNLPNLFPERKPVPTRATPPTEVSTQPTTQVTAIGTRPTATETETATPTETEIPTETQRPGPATDPCSFPGKLFRADYNATGTTNALTAPFSGDVTILKPAGGPNIFSIQEASVQRKFVILLPNLNPVAYDLKSTYVSYTEKTAANDKNPRIWKAASGILQVASCPDGGMALWTASATGAGAIATFKPLEAANNPATGELSIEIGAKIQ